MVLEKEGLKQRTMCSQHCECYGKGTEENGKNTDTKFKLVINRVV
jgi:hypothetical protein